MLILTLNSCVGVVSLYGFFVTDMLSLEADIVLQ